MGYNRKTGSWQVTSAVVMHKISSMHCNAKRFDSQYKRAHLNCNFDHYGWHFLVWHKVFKIPILVTDGFYFTTTATRITMIIRKGNHFEEVVRCLRILFCSPSQIVGVCFKSISTIYPASPLHDKKCQLFFNKILHFSLPELPRRIGLIIVNYE